MLTNPHPEAPLRLAALSVSLLALASAPALAADPILDALVDELNATQDAWSAEEDAPYHVTYRVSDSDTWSIEARYGALASTDERRRAVLDVDVRVGSMALDSTHPVRDDDRLSRNFRQSFDLPVIGDDTRVPDAIRTTIWEASAKEIRDAQEVWNKLQTLQAVKVAEQHEAPDFSAAEPVVDEAQRAVLRVDRSAWEDRLVAVSSLLDSHPDVHWSEAGLRAVAETQYVVNTEGTRIRQPRTWLRVSIQTRTRAEDGMDLRLYRWKDVRDPEALPSEEELEDWAQDLVAHTVALREAPLGAPYDGPILLRGPAAGVFVHEVIGHRVEGHRQKDEDEGQTFRDRIGDTLLPETISIVDDPTIATWADEHLNGHYAYDQEGHPAQRAVIVDKGVFAGFLMSRSPIDVEGFERSNGHGRAQAGRRPVARMANTIVTTTDPVPFEALRKQLVQEVKASGRDFGLIIDELAGGFTLTGRMMPNSFNIRALYGWKVFADGRPDELVRGIDLVGTPLVALSSVVAAGDDPGVFNGFCGAESGSVPNAAVSPSLLIRQLETQKKETGTDRPPLLAKPGGDGSGT
jgi:predicted Zn-dependent protease